MVLCALHALWIIPNVIGVISRQHISEICTFLNNRQKPGDFRKVSRPYDQRKKFSVEGLSKGDVCYI